MRFKFNQNYNFYVGLALLKVILSTIGFNIEAISYFEASIPIFATI
ncbi:MAG: hypothetical protein RL737_726 [Bacteroidota bacterium]|jgi:hypothetical protein